MLRPIGHHIAFNWLAWMTINYHHKQNRSYRRFFLSAPRKVILSAIYITISPPEERLKRIGKVSLAFALQGLGYMYPEAPPLVLGVLMVQTEIFSQFEKVINYDSAMMKGILAKRIARNILLDKAFLTDQQ